MLDRFSKMFEAKEVGHFRPSVSSVIETTSTNTIENAYLQISIHIYYIIVSCI